MSDKLHVKLLKTVKCCLQLSQDDRLWKHHKEAQAHVLRYDCPLAKALGATLKGSSSLHYCNGVVYRTRTSTLQVKFVLR